MKKLTRFPVLCLRCGRTSHLAKDCKVPTLGMTSAERVMADIARRERNCLIGIAAAVLLVSLSRL